jgi:hypothetical protein
MAFKPGFAVTNKRQRLAASIHCLLFSADEAMCFFRERSKMSNDLFGHARVPAGAPSIIK